MKKPFIIHPFLLAIFPVLFLFSHNLDEALFLDIFVPMLIVLIATSLIFILLKFALKNSKKAGLITSVFLVLFFSYGRFYDLIIFTYDISVEILVSLVIASLAMFFLFFFLKKAVKKRKKLILILLISLMAISTFIFVFSYGRMFSLIINNRLLAELFRFLARHVNELLSFVWLAIFVFVSYTVIKSKSMFNNLTKYLNRLLIFWVVFLLLYTGIYSYGIIGNNTGKTSSIQEKTIVPVDELPNIYYIVLDAYGRADKLEELYGYDNSDFIEWLTSRGFYVASKSRSNYHSTPYSLSSSLNMKYLNFLTEQLGRNNKDTRVFYQMIENNEVVNFLKARGYQFVHFSSGSCVSSRNRNADIEYIYSPVNLNEFDRVLIETTWLRAIVSHLVGRERGKLILYNFEKIGEVPNIEEPIFLFAHILSPHAPYVFDQQGNFVPQNKYEVQGGVGEQKQAYINQLIFINTKVKELVNKVLSQSEKPPIIILQSDHGPPLSGDMNHPTESLLKDRMAILNAYYLPNGGDELLYSTVSPVNTFRLIFDFYFRTNYGLLEDKSYFVKPGLVFDFVHIPDEDSIVWDILKKRD